MSRFAELSEYLSLLDEAGVLGDFLTPAEEQEHATNVSAALQLIEWISYGCSFPDDLWPIIILIIGRGVHSHSELVHRNLRLAIDLAAKMIRPGFSLMDLVQEGNKGLMRAAWKYRPDYKGGENGRPIKFSTYATYWIRQAIGRYMNIEKPLGRLPVHIAEKLPAILRYISEQRAEGHYPTIPELAKTFHTQQWNMRSLLEMSGIPLSLEMEISPRESGGEQKILSDIVPDPASLRDPEFFTLLDRELIEHFLSYIPASRARDREVIRVLYGLDRGEKRTLDETGKQFGISRERVRQIESQCFQLIREALGIEGVVYDDWLEQKPGHII